MFSGLWGNYTVGSGYGSDLEPSLDKEHSANVIWDLTVPLSAQTYMHVEYTCTRTQHTYTHTQ